MPQERGYLEHEGSGYLEQPYMSGEFEQEFGMQVEMVAAGQESLGMQVEMTAQGQESVGMQADMVVVEQQALGMQVKADTLRHALCAYYLNEGGYLEDDYLSACMQAFLGMQVTMLVAIRDENGMQVSMAVEDQPSPEGMQTQMVIDDQDNLGMQTEMAVLTSEPFGQQVEMTINDQENLGMQTQMEVITESPTGMQIDQATKQIVGMSARMVIYNTIQLRMLCEFPSRGTAALGGNNWSTTSQAPGDYDINNVNTDIEIFAYRSLTTASVTVTCDTGIVQGVPVDTIAIRAHNFSQSAQVQVQGSNDNFATAPNITFNMLVEPEHMYYIAPTLPNIDGQNRYWRFIIQDPANTDGYLQIGAILFGAADIFTLRDCFADPLIFGEKHFKDENETEGFTSQTNDRALKRFLRLTFDDLNINKGNFGIVQSMTEFARTGLKCLIIPTPEYPSRYAVFAKLTEMPEYSVIDNGIEEAYASFSLEWDESR